MSAETHTGGEIFARQARRCKRCGGLLTSQQAVEDGYGHVCLKKMQGEEAAQRPIPGQMDFYGEEDTRQNATKMP